MISEIRLVSNDGASTAAFFGAIFNAPAVDLGGGRWRVTPVAGPTVTITTARVVEAITRCDMTVVTDRGAADRLRAAGFPVSSPGFPLSAEDLNGTHGAVFLRVVGWDGESDVDWDGESDVDWEKPTPEEPVRDDAYYAGLSDAVERGDYTAAGPAEIRGEEREK